MVDEPVIGIDLGTTFSCVGVFMKNKNSWEILKNHLGKNTTPSMVAFESDKKVIVGEGAMEKQNWIYDVKRVIGAQFNEQIVQEYKPNWPF